MKNFIILFILLLFIFSTNLQGKWKERNNGLPPSWAPACCLAAIGEKTAVIGIYNHPTSEIWLTTDAGMTWREVTTPDEVPDINIIDIAIIDTNSIWICTAESPDSARIFATSDGGKSWEKQYENSEATTYFNYIEMFDKNTGVAMGDAVNNQPALFLQTIDGGKNWTSVNEGYLLGAFSGQTWARIDFVFPECGYFFASGMNPGRLYKTIDNGVTWTPTNLNNYFGAVVKFYDENYGIYVESDGTIFRTSNGFDNRTRITAPTGAWPLDLEFLKNDGSKVYLSIGQKLFYSSDSGYTWIEQLLSLDFSGKDIEFTDDKHGWIITDKTVYYTEDGGMVTSIENPSEMVNKFHLNQNYPNPFNPSTIIEFDLPKNSDVIIEVYNIAGQKIQTLLNEKMPPGNHQVEFNAENLSSGVYFYKIQAGEFQDVKKMVLIR